ncbi:PQQ-dependent sugar dehydrogenase [Alkalihalobacillus hwajinpoensis]|nr:PQQ-dependent sugar dehydrogenase [Pseudalkalibacillus hwajinpoensis]
MEEDMVKIGGLLCALLLVTACSSNDPNSSSSDGADEETKIESAYIENLNVPWEIVQTGETFYLTERSGKIAKFDNSLERQTIQLTKPVHSEGEGGLLGMAIAEDFSQSKVAYLYHTYLEGGNTFNRVVKLKLTEDTWEETDELLANIPGSQFHNGGRLKIGPDGMLYITTGDAGEPELAQDKDSLAGKILRMDLEGNVPEDNPFNDSYVYSYGHRNPQGLAWNEEGQLFSSEHGQSAHDEINQIEAGNNYGWPVIEGDEIADGMVQPIYHSGDDTWAPSGMVFQDDKLYVACLRGEEIRSFELKGQGTTVESEDIGRVRSLLLDEDILFAITNNKDGRGDPVKEDDRMVKVRLGE